MWVVGARMKENLDGSGHKTLWVLSMQMSLRRLSVPLNLLWFSTNIYSAQDFSVIRSEVCHLHVDNFQCSF